MLWPLGWLLQRALETLWLIGVRSALVLLIGFMNLLNDFGEDLNPQHNLATPLCLPLLEGLADGSDAGSLLQAQTVCSPLPRGKQTAAASLCTTHCQGEAEAEAQWDHDSMKARSQDAVYISDKGFHCLIN